MAEFRSLVLTVAVFLLLRTAALDHTHFDNHLDVPVHASTWYSTSSFINREIPAGGSDVDEYNKNFGFFIGVLAPNDGNSCCAVIDSDDSVIISPIIGAGGAPQPGFSLSKNDGNGNPGAELCTTKPGTNQCFGYPAQS